MRIISGIYKGRILDGFDVSGTRPTQDRIKESMFSMIQDALKGADVLDLFAGSGNLGIEALSNGANHTTFVDHNIKSINMIKKNTSFIPQNDYDIFCLDYKDALKKFENAKQQFDIVFLDPPYQDQTISEILISLQEKNLLKEDALVVCELEHDNLEDAYNHLTLIKNKKYGYKIVKIYQL